MIVAVRGDLRRRLGQARPLSHLSVVITWQSEVISVGDLDFDGVLDGDNHPIRWQSEVISVGDLDA